MIEEKKILYDTTCIHFYDSISLYQEKRNAKMKSIIKKITIMPMILGLQIIASLMFIVFLFQLGALPMIYACVIVGIICLLDLGLFFLMRNDHKNSKRTIVGKVISVIISVILFVGSFYIAKGDSTLNSIAGANKDTYTYSVITKKNSDIKDVKDLTDKKISMNMQEDLQYFTKALSKLKEENKSFQSLEVNDFHQLAKDLYNNQCDAIFVNVAYLTMLETDYENFNEDTKIIWTYSIDKEFEDFSKEVDVTSKPFVVYISGIDTFGKVSTVSRSDVNMIVTVNPKTKQVLMTSIPRDYYVTLANKGKKDKLTHSGLAGIENTIKTVEGFMDIDINYYARVNFTSLIQMVDALGGIEVESVEDFSIGQYHYNKGINQLNGDQALYFARARYTVTGGDNGRVANQQRVLMGMLKKMMSPAILTNYTGVLNSIEGCFETNMQSHEITDLIQMQINDMSSWTFKTKQLSGTKAMLTGGAYIPSRKLYYMMPNETSINENKEAIQNILNS